MPIKDISGQRFGRLIVSKFLEASKGYAIWEVVCDCGNVSKALGTHLRSGNTKSCGCLQKEVAAKLKTTHGELGTPTYIAWQNMIRRCEPGGRLYNKVEVCLRWRSSYNDFVTDMGYRPEGNYSLERNDPLDGYYKGNCQWIRRVENTIDTYRGKLTKRGKAKVDKYH